MDRENTVWEKLTAPFNDADVSTGRKNGFSYRYISAPVLRRRLNSVIGLANWDSKLTYSGGAAVCHLTLDVSGEVKVMRAALGYDEPDRPADDVAFSHVCEAFGIGEYLALDEARYARPSAGMIAATIPARGSEPEPAPRDDRPAPPPREERHDDRRDDRPARDERPRYDDRDRDRGRGDSRNGGGNGSQREYGDRGSRGPRNGSGWGQGPRPGGHAYKWLKEQEEQHPNGEGLSKHVAHRMKDRGWGYKISELSEHELFEVVDWVKDYLEGAGSRR